MDIRAILTRTESSQDIQKTFASATCRKKDVKSLADQCRVKLQIYDQIIQKKQSLLKQFTEFKDKFDALSQGLFSTLLKEYQQEKQQTQQENPEKHQTPSKKTLDRNHLHYNHHQSRTKPIGKQDKRKK